MQQDKKAVSQIVTTILIILIVLAAIVIVWNVVKQTIKTSSEDVGAEKFSVSLSTSQVDLSQDPINISVTRSAGAGDIIAIKIIFLDGTSNSYAYENTVSIPGELETITYSIARSATSPDSTGKNLVSFKVYPIIAVSAEKNVTGLPASAPSGGGGGTTPGPTTISLTNCGTLNVENGNYVLNNDLSTTETCFTIAANGITLDMQGNKIIGDTGLEDYGINNSGGYNYITIKNGKIYNFSAGIYNIGDNGNFNDLTITSSGDVMGSIYGIYTLGKDNHIIKNNIHIVNTAGFGSATAIFIAESTGNIIQENTLDENRYGIFLDSSNDNILRDNIIDSSIEGIVLGTSSNNQLINNILDSNNFGIDISGENSNNNNLTNNVACNSIVTDFGCYNIPGPVGTSGTGNIFGSIIQCTNPAWPILNQHYTTCFTP